MLPPPAKPTFSHNPDPILSQDTVFGPSSSNGLPSDRPKLQFNNLVRIAGQRPRRPSRTNKDTPAPLLRPHPRRNSSVVTPSILSRSSSPASSIYAPLASALPSVPSPRRALHFFQWSRKGLQVPADLANQPHSDGNYLTLVHEQLQRKKANHQRRGRRRRRSDSSGIDEEEEHKPPKHPWWSWKRWSGKGSAERDALLDSSDSDWDEPVSWPRTISNWFCCCLNLDEDSDDED